MKSKIGKTITYFRKIAGLTQKQLAEKLYVSDKAVSKWERGLSYPDITAISKLSKILDIDTDALFIEEDKLLAESWCGLLYFPKESNEKSLRKRIGNKYILEIIICYFLLVNINKIIIVCDGKDNDFAKKYVAKLSRYNLIIEIFTSKEFKAIKESNLLKKSSSIMLVYDLFFIYGVGLTSSFQRAILEKPKLLFVINPKIPIVFGNKLDVLRNINSFNSKIDADYIKLFKGYLVINIKSKKDIINCERLIKMIEDISGLEIYNIEDIIKVRGFK